MIATTKPKLRMPKPVIFKATTPYDPTKVYRPQTPAQRLAFRILNLRGLWTLCYRLSLERRAEVQRLIDDEIESLGAERHADRVVRQRAELYAELEKEDRT